MFAATDLGAPFTNGISSIVDGIIRALNTVWGNIGNGLLLVLGACLAIKIIFMWLENSLSGDSVGLFGKAAHSVIIAIIMATAINNISKIGDFAWSAAGGIMTAFTPYGGGNAGVPAGGSAGNAAVGGALDSIFTSLKNNSMMLWDFAFSDQGGHIGEEDFNLTGRKEIRRRNNAWECRTEAEWLANHDPSLGSNPGPKPKPTPWQRCEGTTLVTYERLPEDVANAPKKPGIIDAVTNFADNFFAALLLILSFLMMLLFIALVLFQLIAGVFRIVAGLLFLPVGLAFWPLIDDWGKKAISIVVSGLIQMGIIAFMMGLLGKIVEGMIISYQKGLLNPILMDASINGGKTVASAMLIGMVLVMAIGSQVAISASTGIFSGLSFAVRGVSSGGGGGGGGGGASSGGTGSVSGGTGSGSSGSGGGAGAAVGTAAAVAATAATAGAAAPAAAGAAAGASGGAAAGGAAAGGASGGGAAVGSASGSGGGAGASSGASSGGSSAGGEGASVSDASGGGATAGFAKAVKNVAKGTAGYMNKQINNG